MLKWYTQPAKKYNGQFYRERTIILDEKMIEVMMKIPEAIVVSSWRSLEEQKAMVAKGASRTLLSNHRRGMAVDIVNWAEIDKKLESLGLVNDLSWDQNHYTLEGESKTAIKYPMYDSFNPNEFNQYKPLNNDSMELSKSQKKDLEKLGFDFGDNINESELDKLIRVAILLRFQEDPSVQKVKKLEEELIVANQRIKDLSLKADIGNRFMEIVKMV